MRSITPASSSRRNRSSGDEAAAAACTVSAARPRKVAGSGCTTARFSIQGSRGRTQRIASGSTPLSSSQMHASVAVLPDPAITYWDGASATSGSWLTVMTFVPSHRRRVARAATGFGARGNWHRQRHA